ncbi:MAG: pyridoxal-phosphate dependent enzyme [Pseudomonadota bacterium]
MPKILCNPRRKTVFGADVPSTNTELVEKLLALCPAHAPTPLICAPEIAARVGVLSVMIKDERGRMGLGSFKALGAAYAIACEAHDTAPDALADALHGRTFVTASAGNHGLSVAVGARIFGARAVIYLAETVPVAFSERLRGLGAHVVRAGENYEASMAAAEGAAATQGWTLLSDSTWDGYTRLPMLVMEGYLQLAKEAATQLSDPPTHILLQAGVGGLAASVAAYARKVWADGPQILVVEPEAAPALHDSIAAGHVVDTTGPVSAMGRLDCKTPSLVAFNGLARDADTFVTITEKEAAAAMPILADLGLHTTPSGGAGLAALLAGLDLPADARVWAILSEGPEDG